MATLQRFNPQSSPATDAPLQAFSTECNILKMRRMLLVALFGYVVTNVSTSAQPMPQPSWAEVKKAAKGCSLVVHRADFPASLPSSPGWAYYFDRHSTSTQRTCFYKRLNIGDVERIMREHDFIGAEKAGS